VSQTPLFLAIHLVGLAITFSLGPRRHPALCCALAFPAGLAATVLAALLLLVIGIPYNAWTLSAAALIPTVGLIIARRPFELDRSTWALIAAWTAGFGLISLIPNHWNLSLLNWDSHRIVMLSGAIGEAGVLDRETLSELQSWGVFQVIAHSLAAFTRRDYLYGLQPVVGLSFLPVFALALWHATGHLGATGWRRSSAVALVVLALSTLYAFAHHAVFVHTNFGTAVYLFGFVVLFWLAEIERDPSGLPVAFLFLFALAIQRVELPVVAMIALVATAMTTELPRRAITPWLAAFTVLVVGWYVLLAFHVSPSSRQLTPTRCIAVAIGMTAVLGWWSVSAWPRLQRVHRHVPLLVTAAFVLALAAAFALKPNHMLTSLSSWATNLGSQPHWGYAWYAIAAAMLLAVLVPPPPRHLTFVLTIALSLAYILLLAFARRPYRIAVVDSANRMTIHIVPLVFFYLGLKMISVGARSSSRRDRAG
jgi:hypothetical protein